MTKRVYSIVLSERVVDAIDNLAHVRNTSRSGIIDSILAEYFSYTTPEQHIQEILKRVELAFGKQGTLHALPRSAGGIIDIRSRLKYKYSPTVKYSLALYRTLNGPFGSFKASIRTKNEDLLVKFNEFNLLWARLEDGYLPGRLSEQILRELEPGKVSRKLTRPPANDNAADQLAGAATAYVNAFDSSLKAFFANGAEPAGEIFMKWLSDELLT